MMLDSGVVTDFCSIVPSPVVARRDPLTINVLRALIEAEGSSSEIADELELDWKIVAGTLSNLRKDKKVEISGRASRRRGYAFIYRITNAGRAHVRRYIARHGAMLS